MGLLESRLKRKVKREIKAEQKKAKLNAKVAEAKSKVDNDIFSIERFGDDIEMLIRKYRARAKEAQKNNNKKAFNSYVAQIMSLQRLYDNTTLMMVDAVRHADNRNINREMIAIQTVIKDLVNPKLDISQKEMVDVREAFAKNAMDLTNAMDSDEQFSSLFDGIYEGSDSYTDKESFNSLANEIIGEAAMEEKMKEDAFSYVVGASASLDEIKEAARKERAALEQYKKK